MEKGLGNDSSTSISSSSSSTASSREMFLKNVNKSSHKISKPIRKPLLPPTAAAASAIPIPEPNSLNSAPLQPQPQQPPVYNINKNDFRDVVQKLTGSPANERTPTPPPAVTHPRPPSSRLQRIRPPPLAQIGNRPAQFTQLIPRAQNDVGQRFAAPPPQAHPFQLLPPLPSVHPAAESPISAYMRFLHTSASAPAPSPMWNGVAPVGPRHDSLVPQNEFGRRPPFPSMSQPESPISAYMRFLQGSAFSSSAVSPRGNGVAPPPSLPQPPPPHPLISAPQQQQQQQQAQQQPPLPSAALPLSPFPVLPLSPLPFGCAPSPKSPYGMLSPSFLFSPTGQLGLPQLPLSPTLPVASPRWKGM